MKALSHRSSTEYLGINHVRMRMCAYQGVRNFSFQKALVRTNLVAPCFEKFWKSHWKTCFLRKYYLSLLNFSSKVNSWTQKFLSSLFTETMFTCKADSQNFQILRRFSEQLILERSKWRFYTTLRPQDFKQSYYRRIDITKLPTKITP